jgi:transposase
VAISRVEVIAAVERRRRWSRDEKERLVATSLEPGVSVSEVARMAGLHVSQLFRWRKDFCKQSRKSSLPFMPVEIGPPVPRREVAEVSLTTTAHRQFAKQSQKRLWLNRWRPSSYSPTWLLNASENPCHTALVDNS